MRIDWDKTTVDERKCLYAPCKLLRQKIGLSWEELFQQAFGPRDNVGRRYQDNLAKGKIAPAKAFKLHAWIHQQDVGLAQQVVEEILAIRSEANPERAVSWEMLLAQADFGRVGIALVNEKLGVVEFSRRLPLDQTKLKLFQEFVFDIDCPVGGLITAFQAQDGKWHGLPLDEIVPAVPVKKGQVQLPRDTEGELDPLCEKDRPGFHSFVFVVIPKDTPNDRLPAIAPTQVPNAMLDNFARFVLQLPEQKRAILRLNVMVTAS